MLVPKTVKTVVDGQAVSLGEVQIDKSMNDYSWSEIKDLIQAGHADYFEVGDTKDITFPSAITLNSGSIAANSTWRVVCLGINHNSSKEGTNRVHFCIGKTTGGKDICFYSHRMNSTETNSGGWNGSEMKTWLNETFYNALPSDLKAVITECTKYTDNTGDGSDTSEDVTATSQKIWLLAEFEVFGARKTANQYEQNSQAQYDYYKNGNSKVRYKHNSQKSASYWWLRSPGYDSSDGFCFVSGYGNAYSDSVTGNASGVVPCFTIS